MRPPQSGLRPLLLSCSPVIRPQHPWLPTSRSDCWDYTAAGRTVQSPSRIHDTSASSTDSKALSAGVYRSLGQPESYVHVRGFEPEQMAQMILQFVRAHGQIGRADAANLCRVNGRQASYVLKKLTDRGLLSKQGSGHGTVYAQPRINKIHK